MYLVMVHVWQVLGFRVWVLKIRVRVWSLEHSFQIWPLTCSDQCSYIGCVVFREGRWNDEVHILSHQATPQTIVPASETGNGRKNISVNLSQQGEVWNQIWQREVQLPWHMNSEMPGDVEVIWKRKRWVFSKSWIPQQSIQRICWRYVNKRNTAASKLQKHSPEHFWGGWVDHLDDAISSHDDNCRKILPWGGVAHRLKSRPYLWICVNWKLINQNVSS